MIQAARQLGLNQALQAGIGAGIVEIEVMAAAAADTGRLPDKQATYDQLESMANGGWIGLLNLTVVVLCHDDNKERTFEEKRQQLMQADLSGFQKCQEALAHTLGDYQAETNAYGSEFITMYDLLQLTKSKLNEQVRYEMEDIIARNPETSGT